MELFIQMGHNMQALALEHLEEFDGGTIIISPMNILPNKVKGYATRVHKKKGKVLVDPQLYYPRQYQKKLSQYAYDCDANHVLIRDCSATFFISVILASTEINFFILYIFLMSTGFHKP